MREENSLKKLVVILLALCSLSVLVGCGREKEPERQEFVDGYLTYVLLEDGTYSVKATNVNDLPGNVVIPEFYNGVAVTALEQNAFSRRDCLRTITIPKSITRLPAGAFYMCTLLDEVDIQGSLTGIGKGVFGLCEQHVTIYYPGTKKEWDNIMKASNWAIETKHIVICSDGSI
jgi:hypothetical protein